MRKLICLHTNYSRRRGNYRQVAFDDRSVCDHAVICLSFDGEFLLLSHSIPTYTPKVIVKGFTSDDIPQISARSRETITCRVVDLGCRTVVARSQNTLISSDLLGTSAQVDSFIKRRSLSTSVDLFRRKTTQNCVV